MFISRIGHGREDDRAQFLESIGQRFDPKIAECLGKLFSKDQFTIQIDPENTSHFFIDTKSEEIVEQHIKYKILLISIKAGLVFPTRLEGFVEDGMNPDGSSYHRLLFPNKGRRVHYDALTFHDDIEWIKYSPATNQLELSGVKWTTNTTIQDFVTKLTITRDSNKGSAS
ncbi:MAG: hypothetical protein HY860_03755 [Chlamydiales bacterium]|nr:hypothetical protein [Chlamydiales bacterium]